MAELSWSDYAQADLMALIGYIADRNVDAAQQIKDMIEETASHLQTFPRMGKVGRVAGTRELVVSDSYVLVYQEQEQNVRILRLLHTAQQWPPFD